MTDKTTTDDAPGAAEINDISLYNGVTPDAETVAAYNGEQNIAIHKICGKETILNENVLRRLGKGHTNKLPCTHCGGDYPIEDFDAPVEVTEAAETPLARKK